LFNKETNGYRFTSLSERDVRKARKTPEAHDRLMLLPCVGDGDRRMRIGVPPPYIEPFTSGVASKSIDGDIVVTCEYSDVLYKMLDEGELDIALLMNLPGRFSHTLAEWPEKLVWVKSPGFALSPGAPI